MALIQQTVCVLHRRGFQHRADHCDGVLFPVREQETAAVKRVQVQPVHAPVQDREMSQPLKFTQELPDLLEIGNIGVSLGDFLPG